MKKYMLSIVFVFSLFIFACNNSSESKQEATDSAKTASADQSAPGKLDDVTTLVPVFSDVSGQAAESIHSMVGIYLEIKNALADDKADLAARNASAIALVIRGFDKSLLTAQQKKAYDLTENLLKTGAAGIESQQADIAAQRTHFFTLSKGIYALVKDFGAGRMLYHDHCPMAFDNTGALWISEMQEVRNPYFGAEMLTCGTVEEVIN